MKDATRPPGRKPLTARKIKQVVNLTLNEKPPDATHWSERTMAARAGIAPSSVHKIWAAHGLKPHLTKTFKLSRDPNFVAKVEDIVGVAVLRDPALASNIGQFAAIQSAASFSSGIELSVIDSHDVNEIERGLAVFGHEPNGAIITTASPSTAANRKLVISLLRRYRLPDIYPFRYYPADGGLASYGPDTAEQFKRAAGYVDRILKGAKPSELPVQAPTKYELVLNLKAAKAIGLEIPSSLLTTADEVIE